MKKLLLGALGLAAFAFPSAAKAFPGYHFYPQPYYYAPLQVSGFGFATDNVAFWIQPPAPRRVRRRPVRIDEHCVYKPWNDRVVCRY